MGNSGGDVVGVCVFGMWGHPSSAAFRGLASCCCPLDCSDVIPAACGWVGDVSELSLIHRTKRSGGVRPVLRRSASAAAAAAQRLRAAVTLRWPVTARFFLFFTSLLMQWRQTKTTSSRSADPSHRFVPSHPPHTDSVSPLRQLTVQTDR